MRSSIPCRATTPGAHARLELRCASWHNAPEQSSRVKITGRCPAALGDAPVLHSLRAALRSAAVSSADNSVPDDRLELCRPCLM